MRKPPLFLALNVATSEEIPSVLDEVAAGMPSGVGTSSKDKSEEAPELSPGSEFSLSADRLTALTWGAELEAPDTESHIGDPVSEVLLLVCSLLRFPEG